MICGRSVGSTAGRRRWGSVVRDEVLTMRTERRRNVSEPWSDGRFALYAWLSGGEVVEEGC